MHKIHDSCAQQIGVVLNNAMVAVKQCNVSLVQYHSFITSLLHACTRMAPRSIWRVKILGLSWKNFFPRDES